MASDLLFAVPGQNQALLVQNTLFEIKPSPVYYQIKMYIFVLKSRNGIWCPCSKKRIKTADGAWFYRPRSNKWGAVGPTYVLYTASVIYIQPYEVYKLIGPSKSWLFFNNLLILICMWTVFCSQAPVPMEIEELVDDHEVQDFLLKNPDLFFTQRLTWLGTSRSLLSHYTFERILQHWAVSESIDQKQLTRLLELMHAFKPTLKTSDYQFLPKNGRTLLKIPKTVRDCSSQPRVVCGVSIPRVPHPIGQYIHFGLEGALTATSIGLIHRAHYVNLLRRIHTVHPLLLPDDFLRLTEPGPDEPFDRNTWANWLLKKEECRDTEPVVFEVRINVDGVQWFLSSKVKGTPVLGKIVGVRSLSGKIRVKIPYHIAKPFVIGVYEQIKEKPSAYVLMDDTVREMEKLHPDSLRPGCSRENSTFAVEVTCFNCDDPMRRDLKGIKSSGTFSCERCKVQGVYLNKNGQPIQKKAAKSRKQRDVESFNLARRKAAGTSTKSRKGKKNAGSSPRLANRKAVSHSIVRKNPRPAPSAPSGLRPSHRGSTYFPEQECEPRLDEEWKDYGALAIPEVVFKRFQ